MISFTTIKNNPVTRKCLLAVTHFLYFINRIIPKDDYRILFYDSGGGYLEDNTEALYAWLHEHGYEKKYKLTVCIPEADLTHSNITYRPIGIMKGIWAYLRSKYVFFSYGDFRIPPSKKQIVVNLWHGTPLKKIGRLITYDFLSHERLDNFTYVLATSNTFKPIFAAAWGCEEAKVKVLGHARIDYFFSHKDALTVMGITKDNYQKMLLWMPTFRISKNGRLHDTDSLTKHTLPIINAPLELEQLNQELANKNVLMIIKIHHLTSSLRHPKRVIK